MSKAKEYIIGAIDKLIDDIKEDDTLYYDSEDLESLIDTIKNFQFKIDLYFDDKGKVK